MVNLEMYSSCTRPPRFGMETNVSSFRVIDKINGLFGTSRTANSVRNSAIWVATNEFVNIHKENMLFKKIVHAC